MKKCTKCGEVKPEDAFNWRVKGVKRSTQCKECHREYRKKHYEENREKYIAKAKARSDRLGRRFEKYGLTDEQWEDMKGRYGGVCWICRKSDAVHVDHDHSCCEGSRSCGECIRGALCAGCNTGLGFFKDSPEALKEALAYLEEYNSK